MFFLIIGYTKINQNDTNIIKPTKELQKMDEERKTTKKNLFLLKATPQVCHSPHKVTSHMDLKERETVCDHR